MTKGIKESFLKSLADRYGILRRIAASQSLFDVGESKLRIYVRYSKKHSRNQMFYGLRDLDLQLLAGHQSILCFLWDDQSEQLLIPFAEFEEVFRSAEPANDGQYKVQVYLQRGVTELYIAGAGRFNVESYYGWGAVENAIDAGSVVVPTLSHHQVQTLLGAIGTYEGYHIWVPANDRGKCDWHLTEEFPFVDSLPRELEPVKSIAEEIDVIWVARGSGSASAFFEVEHSTPIYLSLIHI